MSPWPPAGSARTHHRGSGPPVHRPLRRWHRWRASAAVVALLVVLVPGAHGAASATSTDATDATDATVTPPDRPTRARLVVNGLEAVVGPVAATVPVAEEATALPSTLRARVLVENLTDERLADLSLVVSVHERATSRSGLRAALDDDSRTALGSIEAVPLNEALAPLAPGEFVQVELAVDVAELGLVQPDQDVMIHPITITVAQGVGILDEVRTAAVGVSGPVARPMETVVVAPLDGPPAGTDELLQAEALLPGGRLDRLLQAVEATPGAATIAPAAHAAEDLAGLVEAAAPGATDMLARFRAVAVSDVAGVVSSPYGLADVPALESSPATEGLASAAIVAGRQRLLDLTGTAPGASHLLVVPQTPTSLDLAPADVLVALWDDSAGPDLEANPSADIPPALRRTRSSSGRSLDVLVGDPWITQQLAAASGQHGWEVDAHRVVAETAMMFAQAPGREGRALAVVPPVGWDAPGRLPTELYRRLAAAPWLRPQDPVTVAASARVAAPWNPPSTIEPSRTALLSRIGTLQQRLDGLGAAVLDLEEGPAVVQRGDDLLRAASVWPARDPLERSRRVLEDLDAAIAEAIGVIHVPEGGVVRLATERGAIPVTVQHPEGMPLDVLVEVTAQGLLSFDQGTSRLVRLEEGGTATVSFEATALGRGRVPLRVTVRTPTGDVVLARGLVSVRASAVSRPALFAIGGVVLLLLVVGRLRRPQRPQLEVVR